jgi:hypothetical protein
MIFERFYLAKGLILAAGRAGGSKQVQRLKEI